MKFLEHIINNNFISNNTKLYPHPYIKQYYDKEFSNIKTKEITLLEIGVRSGISLLMWDSWFINGEIHGLDINSFNNPKVNFTQTDAYTESALDLYHDGYFDYIIDDGPHTPKSQQFTIQKWINKLKSGGKIIIEDIGCKDYNNNTLSPDESLDFLLKSIDISVSEYKIFDLREIGQYDSIMLEITKK